MKKLLAILVAILAIYSGLWFYGSKQAKEYTDNKWNELVRKADEKGYILTKKGSTLSGFPLGYKLEIDSPSIRSKNNADHTFASHLDGILKIKSNLFGNRYTIGSQGDQHFYVPQENEQKHYILSGDLSLAFDLPPKSFLEGINHPFKNLMEESKNAEAAKLVHNDSVLKIKNLKLVNADLPTLNIFEIEKGYLESDFSDRGEDQRITIEGDFKGFDMLFGGADSYTPSENRSLQDIAVMMSIPKAGKSDISFSFDFNGPLDQLSKINTETSFADGIPPFTATLDNLKISNDFGTSTNQGKFFAKKRDSDGQKFHFNFKSIAEVSEKQEARFRDQWEAFLNNLPICDGKFDSDVCISAKNIVPNWNKQGQLVYHVDLDYDLKNAKDPVSGSALVVKNFDIYTDLYGVKSHGDIILKDQAPPKATYLIELPNYQNLIEDSFNYITGVRGLLHVIVPESRNLPVLDEQQIENTVAFLRSISDEPNSGKKNLSITIEVSGDKITVGKLNAMEFALKLNQFIQQFQPEKSSNLETTPKSAE